MSGIRSSVLFTVFLIFHVSNELDTAFFDTHFNFCAFCRLCLLFVYMPHLQREIEEIKDYWNQHKIRLQKKTDRPNGVPNDLYDFPEEKGLLGLHDNDLVFIVVFFCFSFFCYTSKHTISTCEKPFL